MKIVYLNTYKVSGDEQRFKFLIEFVKHEDPDVLGLSELDGWDNDNWRLKHSFQLSTGLKYAEVGLSEQSNHHIALFSKYPLKNTVIYNKNFYCAALKSNVNFNNMNVDIILVHLSYKDEDARLAELNTIFTSGVKQNPTIFMGDLNSLYQKDSYNETELLLDMKNLRIKKFGVETIRYDVTNYLMKLGFEDTLNTSPKNFRHSVPTNFNKDTSHFTKLRLDYIFVNKSLINLLETSEIIKNPLTEQLSDHYPVSAEFSV